MCKVPSLVDRSTGQACSMVVDSFKASDLAPILRENIAKEAILMTDEAAYYTKECREFAGHKIVSRGIGEYGRGEHHTNTFEGYFNVFKRGMKGVYQHCANKHRHLAAFEFHHNNRAALEV